MNTNTNTKSNLKRIERKAYARLCQLRTRASDDERDLADGGRVRPRYWSVEHAYRRWKRLNAVLWKKEAA